MNTMIGKSLPHMRCPNSKIAKYMERSSFAYIDIFVCVALKVLELNATSAYVSDFDCSFVSGSSIKMAYPAAVQLASDMTLSCLSLWDCLQANYWLEFLGSLFRSIQVVYQGCRNVVAVCSCGFSSRFLHTVDTSKCHSSEIVRFEGFVEVFSHEDCEC